MDQMLAGDDIVVTDTARTIAHEILSLGLPRPARPLAALARLPVVGLLPGPIREAYGFSWTRSQERTLNLLAAATRHALPVLPSLLRYWPTARRATRRDRPAG